MVLLHPLMMAYLVVNPSMQFQRDVKERHLLDSHMIAQSRQTITGRWFKSCAKIKKNGHDKIIGGNTAT